MTFWLVGLGALAGAPARYLLDQALRARFGPAFPLGTLAVNVLGSGALGVLMGANVSHWIAELAGVGLCGALTTFSTFGYETMRLAEQGKIRMASCNVALSIAGGMTAIWIGHTVGEAFFA